MRVTEIPAAVEHRFSGNVTGSPADTVLRAWHALYAIYNATPLVAALGDKNQSHIKYPELPGTY